MKEEKEDEFFKIIMSKSKLELPFPDFEDHVMMQIEEKLVHRETFTKNIRLSWLFFIAGSVFGIIISFILPQIQTSVLGIHPDILTISFQIIITLLVLIQFDALINLTKERISNREILEY